MYGVKAIGHKNFWQNSGRFLPKEDSIVPGKGISCNLSRVISSKFLPVARWGFIAKLNLYMNILVKEPIVVKQRIAPPPHNQNSKATQTPKIKRSIN